MNENDRCLTMPLIQAKGSWIFCLVLLLLSSIFFVGFSIAVIVEAQYQFLLFFVPMVCLSLTYGVFIWIKCQTLIQMTPGGISLIFAGKCIAHIPADRMRGVYLLTWRYKAVTRQLVVSCRSLEELAQLREQKLAKGVFTKDELPFRKRKGDWQRTFAKEFLLKKGYRNRRIDGIWLESSPEMIAAVRYVYPQLPWEEFDDGVRSENVHWKDRDALTFLRTQNTKADYYLGMGFLIGIMLLGTLAMYIIAGLEGALVILGVPLPLLIAMTIFIKREMAQFRLSPDGISIREGTKETYIPAHKIRTIFLLQNMSTYSGLGYMVLTGLSAEDLAKRQEARMMKQASGRMALAAWKQIPGWELRLAARYCNRAVTLIDFSMPDVEVIVHNSQREAALRQLYPHAQWVILGNIYKILEDPIS